MIKTTTKKRLTARENAFQFDDACITSQYPDQGDKALERYLLCNHWVCTQCVIDMDMRITFASFPVSH